MFQISAQQKAALIQAFFDVNAPVKLFEEVRKMLNELPECKKEEPKTE